MTPDGLLGLSILDLGKAAKLLTDIVSSGEGVDLQRLHVVAREADFLEATRAQIHVQAQVGAVLRSLRRGS